MFGKIYEIGKKFAPLGILAMLLLPYASAATEGDIDVQEGTVLAASVFFFFVGAAVIFYLLPQRKEKRIVPIIVAIGIAIAAMAILFYFTELLTGWDITFWDEYIDYVGHKGGVLISIAGDFVILLFTAYAAYVETSDRKERDIVILGILAMIVWSVITLIPALKFNN